MFKNIILCTTNNKKVDEFKKIFNNYFINVEQSLNKYQNTFPQTEDEIIISEETILLSWNKSIITPINIKNFDGEIVDAISVLNIKYLKENILKFKSYSESSKGIIDIYQTLEEDAFGWDNYFINLDTGLSLYELNKKDIKIFSRQKNIANFLIENIYYKNRNDLNFNPQKQETTIEYNNNVLDFIQNNKYINNIHSKKLGLVNLFKKAIHNGGFFKSPKNRREKNYWLPGLNAGIPLVKKKDEIHEITFMVHDLCHFIFPDVFISNTYKNGKNHKEKELKKYVNFRMASEAFTMVLADMIFVDHLFKSGYNYDFNKRKIYPLFKTLNIDSSNIDDIKKLMLANLEYCSKGTIFRYLKLAKNKEEFMIAFKEFDAKYRVFFNEDYKWTIENFENIYNSRHDLYRFLENKPKSLEINLTKDFNINIMLNKFIEGLNYNGNTDNYLNESFTRYFWGQSFIFEKFNFVQETLLFKRKYFNLLNKNNISENFYKLKNIFKEYLFLLERKNLISSDDFNTYNEIYPLFKPVYVFYEKK